MVREELRKQSLRGTAWEEFLSQHCIAMGQLVAGKPSDAYLQLVAYTQPFLKVSCNAITAYPVLMSPTDQCPEEATCSKI